VGRVDGLVGGCGRRLADAIRIVEQQPDIADAADAAVGAKGRQSGFDARVAEDALFRRPVFQLKYTFL
jgi:hypothetical protein